MLKIEKVTFFIVMSGKRSVAIQLIPFSITLICGKCNKSGQNMS